MSCTVRRRPYKMMPRRSRFCMGRFTPGPLAAAKRGYTVLPTSMPNTMASISALKPCSANQLIRPSAIPALARAALSANPGTRRRDAINAKAAVDRGDSRRKKVFTISQRPLPEGLGRNRAIECLSCLQGHMSPCGASEASTPPDCASTRLLRDREHVLRGALLPVLLATFCAKVCCKSCSRLCRRSSASFLRVAAGQGHHTRVGAAAGALGVRDTTACAPLRPHPRTLFTWSSSTANSTDARHDGCGAQGMHNSTVRLMRDKGVNPLQINALPLFF